MKMNRAQINHEIAEKCGWCFLILEHGEKFKFLGLAPGDPKLQPCPNYTSDISEAWVLLEDARSEGFYADVYLEPDFKYSAGIRSQDGLVDIERLADCAPLAICLAWLKWKGIDMEVEA